MLIVRLGEDDEVLHASGCIKDVAENVVESSAVIVACVANAHREAGTLMEALCCRERCECH